MTTIAHGLVRAEHPSLPTKLDVERARDQLERCRDVDEAKSIRDKATAVASYMRTRKASLESQNYAAEIALRAARRLGELTREMPKAKGTRLAGRHVGGDKRVLPTDDAPTLADRGITKKESSRWQALAAIPEKQFEAHVERVKAKNEKLTTSGALARLGPPKRASKPRRARAPQPEWDRSDLLDAIGRQMSAWFATWRQHEPTSSFLVANVKASLGLEEKIDGRTRGIRAVEEDEGGEEGELVPINVLPFSTYTEIAVVSFLERALRQSFEMAPHGAQVTGVVLVLQSWLERFRDRATSGPYANDVEEWDETAEMIAVETFLSDTLDRWRGQSLQRLMDTICYWAGRLEDREPGLLRLGRAEPNGSGVTSA